jgi:flagellar hook-basal body complex protein FliE
MTIDPSFAIGGPEWNVGGVGGLGSAAPQSGSGSSFGAMIGQSIQSLQSSQDQAAQASMDLATGKATDETAVVMAVERAQLAMQLASQIRNKAVEAAQTLFQTQV